MSASRIPGQKLLLGAYALLRRSGFFGTAFGKALFERTYVAYKVLFEARSLRHLQRFIREGSLIIDVGANVGVFTICFARYTGANGYVIAIEPEDNNVVRLRRRLADSGLESRVAVRHAAATDHEGQVYLKINEDHPGDHRLATSGSPVEAMMLDSVMNNPAYPPVSFIKIDIQGAEMKALKGAERLIERDHPALFVEIDDSALRAQGSSARELFAWLQHHGYKSYQLDTDGRPHAVEPPWKDDGGYFDILFLYS